MRLASVAAAGIEDGLHGLIGVARARRRHLWIVWTERPWPRVAVDERAVAHDEAAAHERVDR